MASLLHVCSLFLAQSKVKSNGLKVTEEIKMYKEINTCQSNT